jgi:hypothetical protein
MFRFIEVPSTTQVHVIQRATPLKSTSANGMQKVFVCTHRSGGKGFLNMRSNAAVSGIYSLSGQKMTGDWVLENGLLNLSKLRDGVYIVRFANKIDP